MLIYRMLSMRHKTLLTESVYRTHESLLHKYIIIEARGLSNTLRVTSHVWTKIQTRATKCRSHCAIKSWHIHLEKFNSGTVFVEEKRLYCAPRGTTVRNSMTLKMWITTMPKCNFTICLKEPDNTACLQNQKKAASPPNLWSRAPYRIDNWMKFQRIQTGK